MVDDILVQRMIRWMRGEEAPPYIVEAKLTLRCNLKCSFCDNRKTTTNKYKEMEVQEVPMENWLQLVDDAGRIGVKKFIITGGEPFIRPRVVEMMDRIKRWGMKGTIWTNATLFKKSQIEDLISMGWDEIIVGIDGSNKKIHDELRGLESFNKLKDNIEKITSLKQELNKNRPLIKAHFLINRKNYFDVPNVVKLVKKMNFYSIGVVPLQPQSLNYDELSITSTETLKMNEYIIESKKIASKLEIEMIAPKILVENKENDEKDTNENNIICFRPFYFVHVNNQGYVEACSRSNRGGWERTLPRETFISKNLKEIWYNGEYFKQIREMMINKNYPEFCTKLCISDSIIDTELKDLL